jgi:hypothetical protein
MAAPKATGCFFGETFRGSRNPRGVCRLDARLLGNGTARQTKQNPARRRAWLASLSRCLREHAGQEEICLLQAWGSSGQML